jgi:PKD repeat protein
MAYGSPNAIYYCSQDIAAEAQCSRSDNGGQTFGPGVLLFNPAQCTGGIHGHVKVAADGTVYVPNSSCATNGGSSGVAVSTDNGLTWTQNDVPGSTSTQDPSVGIGQNNVGKPAGNLNGTNTIYFGYADGDGHARIAHSGDRGAHWSAPVDVGAPFGVTHAVFPVVVAGDDNRAAFGFVGTGPAIATSGTCDPYGATLNCANIWHLYIATTYDGGANWITIDATPADPVQQGTVCLQGTLCAGGRNLLDFNDFSVDAEGRGLLGYADGCVNCNNTFQTQSAASHGTIARQSGGRRLFAHFDPIEPMPPASPQMVSAVTQSPSGALVTWLEPDNGGSPITGYNVYRGTMSGAETLLASVPGETTTKYFDPTPPSGNVFYYATAINVKGEGTHCGEVKLTAAGPTETECVTPGLTKLTDPAGDNHAVLGLVGPAPAGTDLLKFQIAQPFQSDGIVRLVFTITTDNGESPQPTGSAWYVAMKIGSGYKAVHMIWNGITPTFESYTPGPNNAGGVDGRFIVAGSQNPAEPTSNYITPFNQVVIVVKASDLGLNPGNTINGFVSGVSQTAANRLTELYDQMPDSLAYTGSYTVDSNQVCKPETIPVAALTANPLTGTAPLTVTFNGSGSSDADGDTIASYTFNFGDGSTPVTQSTPTIQHTYNTNGNYPARLTVTDSRGFQSTNTAQVVISVSPAPTCSGTMVEDDNSHIAYSNGWHLINDSAASAGHYRLNEGGNNVHSAILTFTAPTNQPTGTITYFYATSQKGGSAEVFLDSNDMGPVNYNGPSGSNRAPIFGASKIYNYTASGQHTLEIRPIRDGVFIDGFCIGNATATGTPAAHPGATSQSLATQSAGQTLLSNITLPTGTQAISIAAEPSVAVPIQLVLINPSGAVVQTVNSSSGVAILEAPITQSGVYIIKTVNLSLGPVQIWSVATPLVSQK